jgi:hypothetical protein
MMSQFPNEHIDYIPAPGVWTKQECYDGGVNWQERAPKGSTFTCVAMGKDPDRLR